MQLTPEQRAEIEQLIAAHAARRDQLLAEANQAQGAVLVLRYLLDNSSTTNERGDD
jgi:DNA-binding MarR family transcriptional regulator